MGFWTFDIAGLLTLFAIVFAYIEMKNNKKAELTRQQEKEKAQIQLLIIDWVHGEPFSSTEKNNNGLWGIRISNYSQTAFRDFTLSFQDKKGESYFYAPYIRPGDFFLDKRKFSDSTLFLCYNYIQVSNICNTLLQFFLLKH